MTKILIIEDEPDIRDTLVYNFTNEGFKVKAESSGKNALTLSKSFEPDIVILDLMLLPLLNPKITQLLSLHCLLIWQIATQRFPKTSV